MGYRRQNTRASHLYLDIFQQSGFLQRFKFIGDRPARASGGRPELLLQLEAVYFDHHPVDVIGQLMPCFAQHSIKLQYFCHRNPGPDKWINFESPVLQRLQQIPV